MVVVIAMKADSLYSSHTLDVNYGFLGVELEVTVLLEVTVNHLHSSDCRGTASTAAAAADLTLIIMHVMQNAARSLDMASLFQYFLIRLVGP